MAYADLPKGVGDGVRFHILSSSLLPPCGGGFTPTLALPLDGGWTKSRGERSRASMTHLSGAFLSLSTQRGNGGRHNAECESAKQGRFHRLLLRRTAS